MAEISKKEIDLPVEGSLNCSRRLLVTAPKTL